MNLLSRENFWSSFNSINESYDTEINTKSKMSIFYDSMKKEYKIKTSDEEEYLKPNDVLFNAEINKIPTYMKVQENLIKNSSSADPKRLDKILNELGIYDLFKEEVTAGWFSNVKEDLMEMGVQEPTAQEITNLYPNFTRWSNDAKVAFAKLAQEKMQYCIAKIDILIHFSTVK